MSLLPQKKQEALSLVRTLHGGLERSLWFNVVKNFWRMGMNFEEMLSNLRVGVKAFRPTWGEGEFLWKKDEVLVHNTPYWGGELINQYLDGYPYVCEERDVRASDWILFYVCEEAGKDEKKIASLRKEG